MFSKSQLTLLIGAVLSAPIAHAEITNTDEHMVVTGRDYGYKADTNSTAMRMEMTQLETPGQVAVIDEKLIDEQRASTLGEVLQNDASISAGGTSRNRERFSLRGFELGSSSGFLRDGHQHWSHYRQPVELLERVEVMKGPAGLLYGQSAPGGLVNMVSKKPTYDTQMNFSQDIGSNNHTRSVLDVSGSLNADQTLRGRVVLAKEDYDSWRKFSDGSTPSTDRFVGGMFLDYDVNDNVTVSLHYDRTQDNGSVDSGAYIVDGKPVMGRDHVWDAQWSKIDNDVQNMGFDVKAQLTDTWALNTGFNYQDFVRNDKESYPNFSNFDQNGTIKQGGSDRHDEWAFKTAYTDFVGEFDTLGVQHQLLIGANWLGYSYDRFQRSFNSVDVKPGDTAPTPTFSNGKPKQSHSSYDAWGFYAQDMITVNDYWQVLAGVRFDRQVKDGLAEEAISPKLAAIFHPAENGSIYLAYSESFEPQGMVSSGSKDYINDGSQLDPLRGKQYELGTKWELLDNRLFASAAVFNITQENTAIDIEVGNGLYEKTQAGERVHNGVEVALQGKITDKLSMNASAMYLDAEYTKDQNYQGNRPVDVPEFAASVWSTYNVTEATDVNLGVIYEGSRFGDAANTFKKDGYTRVDVGVAHTYKYDDKLDIVGRVNVENLFDTDYMAGGGSTSKDYVGATGVTLGEGRNFMATIEFKY
ncbi:TonB-dependent siderophore receptor [Photobacterium phosphoreum]|uniref:TonB-dependent siderophore receptor n=1 Tax=Photobacterium phosphoreum TaxID=659 RepID=UPI001E347F4F|nr:TonB-dependent receptor [Photobacterium phosphoreum]MCD9478526.1 TonB-dependent siderophore receptor [Photobacterium phosphoreum]